MVLLNTDSQKVGNFRRTEQGLLHVDLVGGIAEINLNYDKVIEYTTKEHLFNLDSVQTAVGKPITRNTHNAINVKNYKKHAVGTTLQEYSTDEDKLIVAGLIWDEKTIEEILNGDIQHISAGYYATKKKQKDGRYLQTFKEYDHFAALTADFAPRAGAESKILQLDSIEETMEPEKDSSDTPKLQVDAEEISERVELWSDWKGILEQNNKAVDYNMDSKTIKRLVLSCFYPEKALKQLNDDALLKGFWLNFDMHKGDMFQQEEPEVVPQPSGNPFASNLRKINKDTKDLTEREKYILRMQGSLK